MKLIQRDKFSYISFDKFFLIQYIFDVALPITLQLDKFEFSGITLTLAQIFTCQVFLQKIPTFLYLDYTRLQSVASNFHVSKKYSLNNF